MAEFSAKEKIKGFGSGILGFFLMIGFLVLPFILIFGVLKVSEFLYPIISVLAGASIGLFILIVLPLSLFKSLRTHLAKLSSIFSNIVGISVFMFSFLTIFYFLGWIAIFFMFIFHLVAPIAAIGLFIKGEWAAGFSIILGLIFTFGMRFYSIWLESLVEKQESGFGDSSDIIDVDSSSNTVEDSLEELEDGDEDSSDVIEDSTDEDAKYKE